MNQVEEFMEQQAKQVAAMLKEYKFTEDEILSSAKLGLVDRFFNSYVKNGVPTPGSLLEQDLDGWLLAFGAYVGEVLKKNLKDSKWVWETYPAGEDDAELQLASGRRLRPIEHVKERFKIGREKSIVQWVIDEGLPANNLR